MEIDLDLQLEQYEGLLGLLSALTGWVVILMPVFIVWVVFYYKTKTNKDKYEAMVSIASNLDNPSDIEDLLENFKDKKKANRL